MTGQQIVNIANQVIDGLDTTESCFKDIIDNVLSKSNNICVAGGYVLNTVSKYSYGHSKVDSKYPTDIDYWITLPSCSSDSFGILTETDHEKLFKTVLDWCDASECCTFSASVTYMQHKCGLPVQIINTDYKSLEEIILGFDNPASQIGIRVKDGALDILCTQDFLECIKTGIISWWRFDRSNLKRLVKYEEKGFKFAPYLDNICTFATDYNSCNEALIEKLPYTKANFSEWTCNLLQRGKSYRFLVDHEGYLGTNIDHNLITDKCVPLTGIHDTTFINAWKCPSDNEKESYINVCINPDFATYIDALKDDLCIPYIMAHIKSFYPKSTTVLTVERIQYDFRYRNSMHYESGYSFISVNIDSGTMFVTPTESWNGLSPKLKSYESTHKIRILGNFSMYLMPEHNNTFGLKLHARVVNLEPKRYDREDTPTTAQDQSSTTAPSVAQDQLSATTVSSVGQDQSSTTTAPPVEQVQSQATTTASSVEQDQLSATTTVSSVENLTSYCLLM